MRAPFFPVGQLAAVRPLDPGTALHGVYRVLPSGVGDSAGASGRTTPLGALRFGLANRFTTLLNLAAFTRGGRGILFFFCI